MVPSSNFVSLQETTGHLAYLLTIYQLNLSRDLTIILLEFPEKCN